MTRKTPVFHHVRSHKRSGYPVDQYNRGHGKASTVNRSPSSRWGETYNGRSVDYQKLKVNQKERRRWIERMWIWKHPGRVDFNINAQTKTGATSRYSYRTWELVKNRNQLDLLAHQGLDRSRKDVLKYKNYAGNNIYIGSGTFSKRNTIALHTRRILRNQFTIAENRAMGSVFVEGTMSNSGAWGSNAGYPKFKGNYMRLDPKIYDSDIVVTHEFIHAMRWGLGDHNLDRTREEKETELETVCRIPKSSIIAMGGSQRFVPGYYMYVPDLKRIRRISGYRAYDEAVKKSMLHDRKVIMGSENAKMKGKSLRRRLNSPLFHKTVISQAHFSPAEKLDRYFLIKDDGIERRLHIRYGIIQTVATIKRDFIKEYGKDVEVWEYQDGKKVKFISPTKSKQKGFRLFAGKRFDAIAPFFTNIVKAEKRASGIRKNGDFARITAHNDGFVVWRRYRKKSKISTKKKLKIKEINDAITRSEPAKDVGMKAELRKDGSILYSQTFHASTGDYKGKISFNQILSRLWGKDIRYLKKKYGR